MTSPFIFIAEPMSSSPARQEDFKTYWKESLVDGGPTAGATAAAFNAYVDADNKRVTVVQVHPDAASMEFHMSLITEHVAKAYGELLEPGGDHQIYGTPGPELLAAMRQMKGSEDTEQSGSLSADLPDGLTNSSSRDPLLVPPRERLPPAVGGLPTRVCRRFRTHSQPMSESTPVQMTRLGTSPRSVGSGSEMPDEQFTEPRYERQGFKILDGYPAHRVGRSTRLRPWSCLFDRHVVDEADRMESYGLPDQNHDVRDDVHHATHVCSQSGLLHELADEALPRTLAESQTPTRQPPRARDSGGRRGPHQEDLVCSPCQAVRGNALALL